MRRSGWGGALAIGLLASGLVPAPGLGQEEAPIEIGGLLRTGLRLEPEGSGRNDGFAIFDARVRLAGEIGIVFEYFAQAEHDPDDEVFRLLDAEARLPIFPELNLSFGMFRPAFGLEALTDKGALTFVERAQASEAIAPGRQVGLQFGGEAADQRLTYGAGVFNGNGRRLENDGNDFLWAGRAQFNTVGPIPFYEDLVVQVGASIAYSEDTAAELGRGLDAFVPEAGRPPLETAFAGERLLWGLDLHASYRGWSLTGEYLRGDFDVDDPGTDAAPVELDAYGGYLEAGYRAWGAIEGVARYDGFRPVGGRGRDFLLLGINVYPGYYPKFAIQYALGLDDAPPSPFLADGQFLFVAQVDF
ncbi:MAG: porin [Gemmatimonadota bacterium]